MLEGTKNRDTTKSRLPARPAFGRGRWLLFFQLSNFLAFFWGRELRQTPAPTISHWNVLNFCNQRLRVLTAGSERYQDCAPTGTHTFIDNRGFYGSFSVCPCHTVDIEIGDRIRGIDLDSTSELCLSL
jgi:hypothetical protein